MKKRKRKEVEADTATKAACMVGIGPVNRELEKEMRKDRIDIEKSKLRLVRDFLTNRLKYKEDELNDFNIMETRLSSKDDGIINIALEDPEQAKELFIRKAEVMDDQIIVRQYIPPGFYCRYMAINKKCTEARSEDSTLKTQLRFGR